MASIDMKIGLALGGGGARGLAHIPMLEVFDELNITPSVIAGCSAGALVGAAYAAGMSGKDIRAHAEKLLKNRMEFARFVFGTKKVKPLSLLSLHGIASLHLDGEQLADIALPDHLAQNIEDTPIPFKVIATDYENRSEVVFTSGSMLKAVGASIAIPGVISAPLINGRVHVDGGVVNPVPFDRVREGMDIVVAIDVTGRPKAISNGKAGNLDVAIGSLLIMFNQLANLKRMAGQPDIYIEPAVDSIGSGDFFKTKEIFEAAKPAQEELRDKLRKVLNAQLIAGP
jgi:NTE family protein